MENVRVDGIINICAGTVQTDPVAILDEVFGAQVLLMHCPEHHVLVGAALLAAYKNAGGDIDLPKALQDMAQRGQGVPGGACGKWGSCGAALSVGMAISIITGAAPTRMPGWDMSNMATAEALAHIARLGGPRCCKRGSYRAVEAAVGFMNEHLDAGLPVREGIVCRYDDENRECIGVRCPYKPGA